MPFPVFDESELFITAKVRGVIMKDWKIFLCKLAKAGFYCLPGGTIQPGENRLSALRREIVEELGVEPDIGELVYTQEFQRSNGLTTYDFWYRVRNADDFVNVDLSKCSHGFENEEALFANVSELNGNYAPKRLAELVEIWKRMPEAFVQPE